MLTGPDFTQKQILVALLSRGEKVSFKNDNVVILDEQGEVKSQTSCYKLFILFLVGHMSITTGLLQRSQKFSFSIVLMTHGLHVYGVWSNKANGNVLLREKQYAYKKTDIAAYIVKNKMKNQVAILNFIRKKDDSLKKAIDAIRSSYDSLLLDVDLQSLLGFEGSATKLYFQNLFKELDWKGRRPRVKHDISNCLLDIGYTLLFNFIEGLLSVYGFDLYRGVYHQQFYQRKSLVCDIVEPFRPLIDYQLRKAYNLSQIKTKDFRFSNNQYNIFGVKAGKYIELFLFALIERKEEIFYYVQSYYRVFMQDKDIGHYPIFLIDNKQDL